VLKEATLTAFLATTDTERSKVFYTTVLGLSLMTEDSFALALDCHGIELRLQKVDGFRPHTFTALGWKVRDIRAAIADLAGRGVDFERYAFLEQDAFGVWQTPSGARVAWFKDPDGNLLSLTEIGSSPAEASTS